MRFARLSLLKYGHFDNCTLEFPRADSDFHLIGGANEAGKSTTLAAVTDLLFGFSRTTPYDFRFDAPLLRIGATLESGAETHELKRRKGNKDTLLNAADMSVPETMLRTLLHGLSADQFRLGYSLDHRRLREGGQMIVAAKDDIGAALFAAGSGLMGAQACLRDLTAESIAIWSQNRSGSRSYWQAMTAYEAADSQLKAALVRPTAWTAARRELDTRTAEQAALERQRDEAQSALRTLQRQRRVATPASQLAALRATLAGQPEPSFTDADDASHAAILQALDQAGQRHREAATAIAQTQAALAGITIDARLLARQAEITELVSAAGAARKAAQDKPQRERDLALLQADAGRLATELGLPPGSTRDTIPPRPALGTLAARIAARRALETKHDAAAQQVQRDETALALAESALAARNAAQPSLAPGAELACRTAQRLASLAAALPERRRKHVRESEALAASLARLAPWRGTATDLAATNPPPEEACRRAEAAIEAATAALQAETRAVQTASQALQTIELDRAQTRSGRAIPAETLAAARATRDATWEALRPVLTGEAPPPPELKLAAYEQQIAQADALADARFETAEASAKLAELAVQADRARLALDQAIARQEIGKTTLQEAEATWAALVADAGLPPMPPPRLRQWRADRVDALARAEAHEAAQATLNADAATIEEAAAALHAAIETGQLPPATPFATLLEEVQRRVDAARKSAEHEAGQRAKAAALADALNLSRQRRAALEAEIAAWVPAWSAALEQANLAPIPWADLEARLPLFEQLRGTLEQAADMQRRVADITRDQLDFASHALRLASDCGVSDPEASEYRLTEALRVDLQKTIADARAQQELTATLTARQRDLDAAQASIDAAQSLLAPLLARAQTTDLPTLAASLAQSRATRETLSRAHTLEQEILAAGDGHTLAHLLAEAAGTDPDGLAAAATTAEKLLETLGRQIADAATATGQARHAFAALDHGADAALAAADLEAARASIAAEAEAYLIRRAQAVTLKWAIDTYRARQQNPLLARASTLFARLTLGRYAGLQIDLEADHPRLAGLLADGERTVLVDGMSDGTADQLFLALRLAALEQSIDAGIVLPFLADDLFINFDDQRAFAGFQVLGDLARRTQVLFFTHHDHLSTIAEAALHPHAVSACRL
jgi:uncharacterized protein YhaN